MCVQKHCAHYTCTYMMHVYGYIYMNIYMNIYEYIYITMFPSFASFPNIKDNRRIYIYIPPHRHHSTLF